jgi:GntR family transcriptional regulator, transcriptional repressor for pyruvate dehydrogenase complex
LGDLIAHLRPATTGLSGLFGEIQKHLSERALWTFTKLIASWFVPRHRMAVVTPECRRCPARPAWAGNPTRAAAPSLADTAADLPRSLKPIALVQSFEYCTYMDFEPIKSKRIFEEVSRQIEGQIQSGMLKAGAKLPNERELSVSFAVSRHAVREALRSLESIGHLEFRKGAKGGAFVTKGNPQPFTKIMRGMVQIGGISLEQLTEARLTIECAVITSVCKRDAIDLRPLEANVDAAEKLTAAGKMQEKTALNVEFHLLLADLTENPILIMTMRALMNILLDVIQEVGSVMGIDVIKSRRLFVKHLRNRDSAGAVHEMERHLNILHEHYVRAASRKSKDGVSGHG